MRIVHPNFQRIDLHSSLSFPYDNPPIEVIFARWQKDVRRFNKLNAKYPVEIADKKAVTALPTTKITIRLPKMVSTGMLAYAILYSEYKRIGGDTTDVTPAELTVTTTNGVPQFTFDSLGFAEIVHFDLEEAVKLLNGTDAIRYEAYSGVLPRRVECFSDAPLTIWSTHNRLISVNSLSNATTNNIACRHVNIQGVLRHFAAQAILGTPKTTPVYWDRYRSLLLMAERAGKPNTPFFLSVETYGNKNVSHAMEKALSFVYRDLEGKPTMTIPKTYKPENSRQRPEFDYESNSVFSDRGRRLSAP
jgi:hypothetical protein